ncbi:endo alpha-1,4 polygalactosaminidase [Lacticaseibacillus jixiensis]|uniref:endo alpha-1,4 polygalactosaminidase n=1 Tax=Lacticaseibacillus jixiensis TaxID=3231926 RepID=UPI0036F3B410
MRKGLLVVWLVILAGLMTGGEWMQRSDFKIYYGQASAQVVQQLSAYPLVIVEPNAWSTPQLQTLTATSAVYGYVNVMEMEPAYELPTKARLQVAGKPVAIPAWDTYMLDLTRDDVQQALTAKVERLAHGGYTGVFLDTVGDIDDYLADHPQVQASQREALREWLGRMQARFPDLDWLQNRGFATYIDTSQAFVKRVLWEDFRAKEIREDQWSRDWLKRLQATDAKLYAVCADSASLAEAKRQGMLVTYNPNDVYDVVQGR